jgi:hypothetical protein
MAERHVKLAPRMFPIWRWGRGTRGIVHTIKDGVVIENARLMSEVERIVAASKQRGSRNIVTEPFVRKE